MSNQDLDLFIKKNDSYRWAKNDAHESFPNEDYSRILFKNSELIKSMEGYNQKLNLTNKILIFKNINNQHIAHVATFRKPINKHKLSNDEHCQEVCVATYLSYNNKVILLNHFDPIGKDHSNNYSIYPEDVRYMYENYFTDYVTEDEDNTYFVSKCPHFHFNSAYQTENLGGQEHANSISIHGLIRYLKDLNACTNKKSPLLQNDLDMPFLTFKLCEHKYKYTSLYEELISKIISIGNSKRSYQKYLPLMENLQEYINKKQPTNNIERIILDLKILNMAIHELKDDNEMLAIF